MTDWEIDSLYQEKHVITEREAEGLKEHHQKCLEWAATAARERLMGTPINWKRVCKTETSFTDSPVIARLHFLYGEPHTATIYLERGSREQELVLRIDMDSPGTETVTLQAGGYFRYSQTADIAEVCGILLGQESLEKASGELAKLKITPSKPIEIMPHSW